MQNASSYFDIAQMTLYLFWIFFAGLIIHIRREDHREGFPLVSDLPGRVPLDERGVLTPVAKTFLLNDGTTYLAPHKEAPEWERAAVPVASFPGAPLTPTGNPLVDGVGPAAYAMRRDIADVVWETGEARIVPARLDPSFTVAAEDPNPVGMQVFGCDGNLAGVGTEIWVDRSETVLRFVEVELTDTAKHVLLPATMMVISAGRIKVRAITAAQFQDVPQTKSLDQITRLEEDKIYGYYAGGTLYATPERTEPLI